MIEDKLFSDSDLVLISDIMEKNIHRKLVRTEGMNSQRNLISFLLRKLMELRKVPTDYINTYLYG